MLELLAPAGGKEHFLAAVDSGADAVYFGLKRFSARNSAENFDFEQLDYCLKYAKTFGVRAYAAMNTLVKDSERKDFIETVLRLYEMGVDGFIVQDIFLGKRIKAEIPEIRLHLSTQGGACNAYAAEVAKEFGFSRIVAAARRAVHFVFGRMLRFGVYRRQFGKPRKVQTTVQNEVFVKRRETRLRDMSKRFVGRTRYSRFAGYRRIRAENRRQNAPPGIRLGSSKIL